MLLRRITKHVKDQNWFAVFIDFLIVVFGVFLGIQIGNWNESRLDHQAYLQAHDRMIKEVRDNIETVEETLRKFSPMINNFKETVEDIRTCRDDEEAKARINKAISQLNLSLAFRLQINAINQITNNERFLEQQTPKRRDQNLQYAAYINLSVEWSEQVSKKMDGRSDELHPYLDYGPYQKGGEFWERNRIIELSVELKVACQDDAFRKLFYQWENGHNYQLALMDGVVTKSKEFLHEQSEEPMARAD